MTGAMLERLERRRVRSGCQLVWKADCKHSRCGCSRGGAFLQPFESGNKIPLQYLHVCPGQARKLPMNRTVNGEERGGL